MIFKIKKTFLAEFYFWMDQFILLSIQAIHIGHDSWEINFDWRREKLVLEIVKVDIFVKLLWALF